MFPKVGRVHEMKTRGRAQKEYQKFAINYPPILKFKNLKKKKEKDYQKLPDFTGRRLRFRTKVSWSFFREVRFSGVTGKVEGA